MSALPDEQRPYSGRRWPALQTAKLCSSRDTVSIVPNSTKTAFTFRGCARRSRKRKLQTEFSICVDQGGLFSPNFPDRQVLWWPKAGGINSKAQPPCRESFSLGLIVLALWRVDFQQVCAHASRTPPAVPPGVGGPARLRSARQTPCLSSFDNSHSAEKTKDEPPRLPSMFWPRAFSPTFARPDAARRSPSPFAGTHQVGQGGPGLTPSTLDALVDPVPSACGRAKHGPRPRGDGKHHQEILLQRMLTRR